MLTLRNATRADLDKVWRMIEELAAYERLPNQLTGTAADLERALFADPPRAFCDLAEWSGEVAGFAVWFYNFSTFEGRHGIYLEDVFVRPHHRRRGIGAALMARLAQRCLSEGLPRLEWRVLAWNAPAEKLFETMGAPTTAEWRFGRMSGAVLARLAETALPDAKP